MRVWDFLTKRELLRLWLAEGAVSERVGSAVELRFNAEESPERKKTGSIIRGIVFRSEMGSALSYSWTDKTLDSVVTIELESVDDRVMMVLTHADLAEPLLARCGAGWHAHLEILEARLKGEEPPAFQETFKSLTPIYEARARGTQKAS
jgi:uncharacterized protein YndB with AHSA1/START domain